MVLAIRCWPLSRLHKASNPKSIALIGFAGDGAVVHGGGSGSVVASYTVTPLEGMGNAAGDGAVCGNFDVMSTDNPTANPTTNPSANPTANPTANHIRMRRVISHVRNVMPHLAPMRVCGFLGVLGEYQGGVPSMYGEYQASIGSTKHAWVMPVLFFLSDGSTNSHLQAFLQQRHRHCGGRGARQALRLRRCVRGYAFA